MKVQELIDELNKIVEENQFLSIHTSAEDFEVLIVGHPGEKGFDVGDATFKIDIAGCKLFIWC